MSIIGSQTYYTIGARACGLSGVHYIEGGLGHTPCTTGVLAVATFFNDKVLADVMANRLNGNRELNGYREFTVERLTFTVVKSFVSRHYLMTLTKTECGEYRLNFRNGHERTAYYTDDLADVLGTARLMSKEAA